MGYFRRFKASRYTLDEVKRKVDDCFIEIISSSDVTEQMLTDWACWRELQARLENDNEGREQ